AGFVMANGSLSSNSSGEGDIRRAMVEADLADCVVAQAEAPAGASDDDRAMVQADLVDCVVALPGQLFYTTQIPVCLWFLARNRKNSRFRDRRGETLFIDARKLGAMVDCVHRELTNPDIARIAGTYHAVRGGCPA